MSELKSNFEITEEVKEADILIFPNSCAYYAYKKKVNGNIQNYFTTYIVYLEDKPIGVSGLYELPEYSDTVWLNWFGLLPQYRKMGYGNKMFEFLIDEARNRNKDFLRLYTSDLYNNDAINFYIKHMEIKEDYFNELETNKDMIKKIMPKIYGLSLTNKKITLWNNKFINISDDLEIHNKSLLEIENLDSFN